MRWLLLISVLCTGLACKKDRKCIKSLGDRVTVIRTPGAFTEVRVTDKINIILEPWSSNEVVIEAGENMVPFIDTYVEGNVLFIEDNNKCDFLRSYKKNQLNVRVRYTQLKKLYLTSSGNITCADTLRFTRFFIEARSSSGDIDISVNGDTLQTIMHTGTSNVHVTGITDRAEIYSGGNGIFHLENLRSDKVFSNNSGTGDFYVHATSYLFAYLHLIGNTYYKGTPDIDVVEDHEGRLYPIQ